MLILTSIWIQENEEQAELAIQKDEQNQEDVGRREKRQKMSRVNINYRFVSKSNGRMCKRVAGNEITGRAIGSMAILLLSSKL